MKVPEDMDLRCDISTTSANSLQPNGRSSDGLIDNLKRGSVTYADVGTHRDFVPMPAYRLTSLNLKCPVGEKRPHWRSRDFTPPLRLPSPPDRWHFNFPDRSLTFGVTRPSDQGSSDDNLVYMRPTTKHALNLMISRGASPWVMESPGWIRMPPSKTPFLPRPLKKSPWSPAEAWGPQLPQ